jgi:hypothetical protein
VYSRICPESDEDVLPAYGVGRRLPWKTFKPRSSANEGQKMLPAAVDDVQASPFHDGQSETVSTLIHEHLGLARGLASRYAGRGEPYDELVQVAMVGLVLAANRFDPERGTSFGCTSATIAGPSTSPAPCTTSTRTSCTPATG